MNAAGLLRSRSIRFESPEKRAARELQQAKEMENKIHSRVRYLMNQEKWVANRINQARQSVLKILSVKEQKEKEA
jgi:hypothetical protein